MIGRLKGILLYKHAPELLIDVGGVGYEVQASMTTFYQLPAVEQAVCLYTQLIVREDAHTLFGFYDLNERDLFRALIKVNSVGPKLALTILSSATADEFTHIIMTQDTPRLSKIPGIGKKTAERLLIELRDKLKPGSLTSASSSVPVHTHHSDDALSALVNLGYGLAEASRAIQLIADSALLSTEAIIKSALKSLAR